jgi:hypothetical protein
MALNTDPDDTLVLSYLELRASIGTIGILLPWTVAIGKIILQGPGILSSISAYYYSVMGNVFVGSLCAIGVFLWSYKGYERRDAIAGNIAAVFAIGVALFPTNPDIGATAQQMVIGTAHLMFAIGFFLTLAYFALVLFRKTNPTLPPTRMKLVRNMVYTICGYTILAAIAAAIALAFVPRDASIFALSPLFWLESIAITAFGISWFVKGEAILKDE